MQALSLAPEPTYLLAISGGGDSMALAHMAHAQGLNVAWAHVHHGWSTADDEACAFVQAQAKVFNVSLHLHRLLQGMPTHNAEAHAREARYRFFAECCTTHGYAGVVLAHTQTDVAETFLMRAGKGSGVSGLAAMQPLTQRHGLTIFRPLLKATREELRAYLHQHGQLWVEDPANSAQQNQRAKIRALLPVLAEAGVPVHGLAAAAQSLARAEKALASSTPIEVQEDMPLEPFIQQPTELALRHVAKVLEHHFPNQLPPRTSKRLAFINTLKNQPKGQATLGGLVWRWDKLKLRVWPESKASST